MNETIQELETIRGAIEKSPHPTISLSCERVLRWIELAIEALKARNATNQTEK